jgi:hypothetical protein
VTDKRTFLVEAYVPASSRVEMLTEQAVRAASTSQSSGWLSHIRSILVADEETCFHLYEADSAETVARAMSAVAVHTNRIVEVASLP